MHSGVSFIILQMDSSADAGKAAVPCASRDGCPFGGISGESSLLVKYTLLSLLPIKHQQQKQMRTPVRDRLAELALLLHRRGQPTVITGWPSCHPRRLGLPGPWSAQGLPLSPLSYALKARPAPRQLHLRSHRHLSLAFSSAHSNARFRVWNGAPAARLRARSPPFDDAPSNTLDSSPPTFHDHQSVNSNQANDQVCS